VKRVLAWLFVVILLALAGFGAWLFFGLGRPYKGYQADEQFVEIPQGAGTGSIGTRLVGAGVIRDTLSFRFELLRSGTGRRLQAGEYRFDRPMTVREVVAKIARGDVYLQPITFPEGLTIRQMSELFESKGFGPAQEFVAAASDAEPIHRIDPEARDLEGYLFPDTYALPRRTTAAQLVARMVDGFEKVLTPGLRAQAASRGLSVRELVTLASVVEKETGNAEERPLVSAVCWNRLKIGMRLQVDPTVIHALERAGRYTGNITRDDLQIDSPYNTYRYAGLPPGPIAAPGRASLEAAANPANVPYLYFVSRNDGRHAFASTLDEHNRNVVEFQKNLNRTR
jgi:peptidoglycan lytic transglycosylase G